MQINLLNASRSNCRYLNKGVNVVHQGLRSSNDKLVHTGNSMRPKDTHEQPSDYQNNAIQHNSILAISD